MVHNAKERMVDVTIRPPRRVNACVRGGTPWDGTNASTTCEDMTLEPVTNVRRRSASGPGDMAGTATGRLFITVEINNGVGWGCMSERAAAVGAAVHRYCVRSGVVTVSTRRGRGADRGVPGLPMAGVVPPGRTSRVAVSAANTITGSGFDARGPNTTETTRQGNHNGPARVDSAEREDPCLLGVVPTTSSTFYGGISCVMLS
jgi:hypothetical protein